jgi:hypothetical protein
MKQLRAACLVWCVEDFLQLNVSDEAPSPQRPPVIDLAVENSVDHTGIEHEIHGRPRRRGGTYDDVVSCGTSRTPSTRIALMMVSKLGFPFFDSAL